MSKLEEFLKNYDRSKALTILDAVRKFGWPEPGSAIVSRELLLGDTCNARCVFCCAKDLQEKAKWLPIEEIKANLRKWAAEGAWLITFSGGEATLYPNLEEISEYAKKCGFKSVQVLTNGLKMRDLDYVRRLSASGIDEVKISLHGSDAATHDALMQVSGAFDNAMIAVQNLNEAGIKASFNFAVTAKNYRQMPLFAKLAGTELGLTGICFMFSFYSGGMLEGADSLGVQYKEIMPSLRLAMNYIKAKKITIESKMLSNFVPCLAPEYTNIMSDWGYDGPEASSQVGINGKVRIVRESYPERKELLPQCRECVYASRCYGPDKGYVSIYGGREFVPLKEEPKTFPHTTLYP